MNTRIEVSAYKAGFRTAIQLLPLFLNDRGEAAIFAHPPTVEKADDSRQIPPHAILEIDEKAAQKLMDQLWDCGVRPSAGSGSAGQLASIQYHLEDMRNLVFKEKK